MVDTFAILKITLKKVGLPRPSANTSAASGSRASSPSSGVVEAGVYIFSIVFYGFRGAVPSGSLMVSCRTAAGLAAVAANTSRATHCGY